MYARTRHSYTHLILALGVVREPTVWGFMTSQYPGKYDIGLPAVRPSMTIEAACDGVRTGNDLCGAVSLLMRWTGPMSDCKM